MKLYELSDAYIKLQQQLDNEDTDSEAIRKALEEIEDRVEEKLENIAKLIESLDAETKAIKGEEMRLRERRQSLERKIDSLKEYAQEELNRAGMRKVKSELFTIYTQQNPRSVKVVDKDQIPEELMVVSRRPDKKHILELIDSGQDIPGVEVEQSESLRIR